MVEIITIKNNNSIWITANAGSGKTTFLTRRVVALLLQGVAPERICCITYTKAAASEMRSRVLSLLRHLLLADEAACAARVDDLLGRAAKEADIAQARRLFGTVLDSPGGGLQLTTIHGFCQNILRRFPLEAGIAPHFTVLEDAAAERLFTQCKHRLLRYYNASDAALNAALELVGTRSSEMRFDGYLSDIIAKRGQWEIIWRNQTPELLRARLFALHGISPSLDETALHANYCDCIDAGDAAILCAHLPAMLAHKNKREREEIAPVLAAWLEADAAQRSAMIAAFKYVFLTRENALRVRLLSKEPYGEDTPVYEVMQRLGALSVNYHAQCSALACAQESYAVALLARALLELYAQAKAEIHALDYDDLIGRVRQLFANPAQLGWVMSKLDHRIDHLLIDEAQDTSGEQWSIAQLLVEELIAANDGVGSGEVPRSLLVVGDEKQSIYSFQGAAPELFAAKKSLFGELLEQSLAPLAHETLATSYRSAQAILTLVDHVASQPEIAEALSAGGIPEPHRLKRLEAVGSVTLYAPQVVPEREPTPALTLPISYADQKSGAQLLADSVAEQIAGWFAQGRMLESEGRKLTPGDILILVKNRTGIVLPLIRALQKRKVAVAGIDRLTLSAHLAVRDLLALMRWVLNPADDLALAQVLRSPLIGLSDEALRALCIGRVGTLWARIADGDVRAELQRTLDQRELSPYAFLTEQLEVAGARRNFAARFGEEVHEVLDELKAQAAAMPADLPPTLAYFHDWMEGSTRQIKREMETDDAGQVRIMTVHGAKGLEAPVVLLVDTVSVPTTGHEKIFFAEDAYGQRFPALAISEEAKSAPVLTEAKAAKAQALLAEYDRLLYVALTRARDELHLFGMATPRGVKANSWYQIVAESLQALGAEQVGDRLILCDTRNSSPHRGEVRRGADSPAVLSVESTGSGSPPPNLPPMGGGTMPPWANRHAPAVAALPASLSPSQLGQGASVSAYAASGEQDARTRGVRIHRVLELLTGESDAAAIARLVRLISPDWSEVEQAAVTQEIASLHAQERWIWQSPSQAEVTIAGTLKIAGRDIAVHGQIDRLIELPDIFAILDYKTGRMVPKEEGEISESYRMQLKIYRALVENLSGKPVRCAILWTAAPALMWCDAAVAATSWPNEFVMKQTPLVA